MRRQHHPFTSPPEPRPSAPQRQPATPGHAPAPPGERWPSRPEPSGTDWMDAWVQKPGHR